MTNQLIQKMAALAIMLGMVSGAWADQAVMPVQQDSVDMGRPVPLGYAETIQAGSQATLAAMQATASVLNGTAAVGNRGGTTTTFDGSPSTTMELPRPEYEYLDGEGNPIKPRDIAGIEITEDGSIITEFSDGSGFALHENYVVRWDEDGRTTVPSR